MISEQKDRIEKVLDEWRQTFPSIPDLVWEDLSAWIMSLRENAKHGHYVAYFKCLWRPPEKWGTGKSYRNVFGAFILWMIRNGHARLPWTRTTSQTNLISAAPGSSLLSLVEFLFSPYTVEHTFKPIVADWRTEFFDALHKGRYWKARWVRVRYTFSFVMAMGLSKVFSLVRSIAGR